jgi:hypothetical protein
MIDPAPFAALISFLSDLLGSLSCIVRWVMTQVQTVTRGRCVALASVVSEVFGPAILLTVLLFEVGLVAAGWEGLLFAFVATVFVAVGPYLAVIWMSHRGKVSDRFVGNRKQRAPVLLGVLGSIGVGLCLLIVMGAPREVLVTTICAAVGLVLVMVVNLLWKLSIHSAIAMFFALAQVILFGTVGLLAFVVPVVVGWARVRVQAHNINQVIAGAGVGVIVSGIYFLLL